MWPRPTGTSVRTTERLRIVVGGFLGLLTAGGVTWDYVQYPVGFAALGHDVVYVEDTRLWPVFQKGSGDGSDCAPNVAHLSRVMDAFGLGDRWAYRDEVSGRCFGLSEETLRELCRTADVFVNLSCSTFLRDAYRAIPVRVLIDTDPMFTQIQYERQTGFTPEQSGMRAMVDGHTHHFTFGENIAAGDCRVPTCGIPWRPTRQPICLDKWPVTPLPVGDDAAFTTVMNWTAAPPLEYAGETWGQKNVEFARVATVPQMVPTLPLAVAVSQTTGDGFPIDALRNAGWGVLDAGRTVSDWRDYRRFLQRSRGEFSVAKETYVKARTGWFSCRSACYLASGRPVVTQDTAWTRYLPSDCGLLAFSEPSEAVEALRRVAAEPEKHARAARAVAEEHFRAERILDALLQQVSI